MSKMFCGAKKKSAPRFDACPGEEHANRFAQARALQASVFSRLNCLGDGGLGFHRHCIMARRRLFRFGKNRRGRSCNSTRFVRAVRARADRSPESEITPFPPNWIERAHRRWSSFLRAGHILLELTVDGIVVWHFHDAVFFHIFRISGLQCVDHPRILGGNII